MSSKGLSRRVLAALVAVSLLSATALTGCTGIDLVTNSEPPQSAAQSTLPQGTTITEGTLTVGIDGEESPYGGANTQGDTVGLNVDVAAALADHLGCKLQIVSVSTNGLQALEQGLVDVSLGLEKSGSNKDYAWSEPYVNDGISLFCLSENAPATLGDVVEAEKDLAKEKVIVQDLTEAYLYMRRNVSAEQLVMVDTMKDGFEALRKGEAKYLAADAVLGSYFMRDYDDVLRINFVSTKDISPRYAVTLAKNAEMTKAVFEALQAISGSGVLRVVTAKWLGEEGESLLPSSASTVGVPKSPKFG